MMKHIYTKLTFLFLLLLGSTSLFANSNKTYYSKVSVTKTGNGTVYVKAGSSFSGEKTSDTQNTSASSEPTHTYSIKATAADGYVFTGWSGSSVTIASTTSESTTCTIKATSTNSSSPTSGTANATFQALPVFYFKSTAYTNNSSYGNAYTTFESSAANSATSTSAEANVRGAALSTTSATKTAYFRAVAKTGYVFKGWSTSSSESDIFNTNASITYNLTSTSKSSTSPAEIQYYAIFGTKFAPQITGTATTTKDVDDSYTADFTFTNTSTVKPSALSSADFYFTINHQLSSNVNNGSDVISYDPATNKVTALNAGTATITFTNKSTATHQDASATFTIIVNKKTPSFSCGTSMNVDASITSSYTNTSATAPTANSSDNFYYVLSNNTPTGNTDGSTNPNAIISFANNQVTGTNAGTATITFYQKETYKYSGKSQAFNVTVNKIANPIAINGSANLSTTVYQGSSLNLTISSPNTTTQYEVTQTQGNTYATYVENNGNPYIQATLTAGTAKWTISQEATYKYLSGSTTLTVQVKAQTEATNCYVLRRDAEEGLTTELTSTGGVTGTVMTLSGPGATLTFDSKKSGGLITNFYIEWSADGNQWNDLSTDGLDLNTSYQNFSFDIKDIDVKYLRFESKVGATLWQTKYSKNVKVTRKTYINANNLTIDRNGDNYIFPDETGSAQLTIDWSCANGGDLKLATSNEKFRLSQSTITNVDCNSGSTTITVYYDADEATTETADLYIYNNVYLKKITLTGICRKHDQQITWRNGVEVMQQGTTVTNPASAILDVTYSSDKPSVISVSADGKTLTALSKGTAHITATAEGSKFYYEETDTKTFQVTDKKAQYIIWNQSLIGLRMGDADITLNAYATSELECTTNSNRPITYESDNTSVATIVNGNKLHIVGEGTAIITATQAGGEDADGHDYVATTATNNVLVAEPSTGCHPTLNLPAREGELFSMNTNKPQLQFDIELNPATNGEPKSLTFDCKRTKYLAVFSSGKLIVAQKLNGEWVNVKDCGEPTIGSYDHHANIPINRNATAIRFYRPQGGEGYHSIANVEVAMAQYIEAAEPELIDAKLGETKQTPINVHYSGLSGILTFRLTGRNAHFSIDKNAKETSCGSFGSELVQVSYRSDVALGEERDTLFASDGMITDTIVLRAQTSTSERAISWDIDDEQDIYTVQTATLAAECRTTTDLPAGTVYFRMAEGSTTGAIENNVLSFTKDGTAIVEAYVLADPQFEDAEPVRKTFNVALTPTEITEAPTPKTLILGYSATDLRFVTGSGVAIETINEEAIDGTFAGVSGDVSTEGTHTIHYKFTPSNTDMYAISEGDIEVSVVNCIFETAGNWEDAANWTTTDTPEDEDVIIAADVTINTDVVVNDITFNAQVTITIKDQASLTINGETTEGTEYGNIIVEAGGQLNLGSGTVELNDFTLHAAIGDDEHAAKSGQVSNEQLLQAHGHTYFVIDIDPREQADDEGWYFFTVPFQVNAMTGITRRDGNNWIGNMKFDVDYSIMTYHEELRAQGKYGWQKFKGIMQPGVAYLFGTNFTEDHYRFEMVEGGSFNSNHDQALQATTGGTDANKGWNGVGNGTMTYVTLTDAPLSRVQMYNHGTNSYDVISTNDNQFVVGSAYFVQAESNSTLTMVSATDAIRTLRAPARTPMYQTDATIAVSHVNSATEADQMYILADEDATSEYVIGKDLLKMGTMSQSRKTRIWTGMKPAGIMCSVYAPMQQNEATVPFGLYLPTAGTYTISARDSHAENVYLLRNGVIIWDLSMSDYNVELASGVNYDYSILLVAQGTNTATGVDNLNNNNENGTIFVEKMIVDGKLFLLRDGILYDATGKKVESTK